MFIRNIITTSALVVLLGLSGGSAYADDLGDRNSHTPGSATPAFVYDVVAYKAYWANNEFASIEVETDRNEATNESDSFMLNEIPFSDK